MEEMIGYLIAIAVVLFLLYLLIVYVILPAIGIVLGIGLVILGGITLVGVVSGFAVGFKNFVEVLIEAHGRLP